MPPPASWAAIKPAVWGALAERRARGAPVPRLLGYPLCGFGGDHLELEVVPEPDAPAPPPCRGCAKRAACSPPARPSDELQPFSGAAPLDLFRAFTARHRAALRGAGRDPIEGPWDEILAAHLEAAPPPTRQNPVTLEPSLLVGEDGLEPALRLGVFHGPGHEGEAGRARTARLLESFRRMHAAAGAELPGGLCEALTAHAPIAFPVGLEARAGEPPLLKAYVMWQAQPVETRRALVLGLAALAGCAVPPSIPWADLGLVGLGTRAGRLASLKLYLRGAPTRGAPAWGLPALAPADPLVRLSEGLAYAVLDLVHPSARPPKWDLSVRRQLLPGPVLSARLGDRLGAEARAQVDAVVRHHAFRSDLVAVGLRGARLALYLELA